MIRSLAKVSALAGALLALHAPASAQLEMDDIAVAAGPPGQLTADQREKDRATILFLASHLRKVDAEMERARNFQIDVVKDAEEYRDALAARKRAADEARRKANARAARNLLFAVAGADDDTIDLMNSINDVSDILSADTEEERAAIRRRTFVPAVSSLLLGADTATLNDIRAFDNAATSFSAGRRARNLQEALEQANSDVQRARVEADRVGEYIRTMEAEKARALALLDEMNARYLAEVNAIVAHVPGFTETFGRVHDMAFSGDLDLPDTAPLIVALTFAVPVPDRAEPEIVDVKLADIREFVEDGFATLVAQRDAQVARLEADLAELERGIDDSNARRGRIQAQVREQEALLARTSGFKFVTRGRIQSEIDRLNRQLSGDTAHTQLGSRQASTRSQLAEARPLAARARAAQRLFGRIDASGALDAVRVIEQLL